MGLAGSGATSGVAMAHYELHAWCLLVLAWVFVPFYMRSMVFTMPEFLERRFNEKSRYVLSIVSIITFIISKIAVGIFAGGVVFGTLFPQMSITLGGVTIDSFWIGSVLVIVLTGLYTTLGGMRAVAYNDAVQVTVLILGSFLLTAYGLVRLGGWHELREICGSDMFNLWKPLIPHGVARHLGADAADQCRGRGGEAGLVFQRQFPVAGHAVLRARSSACGTGARTNTSCSAPWALPTRPFARRGSIFAAFLKLFPVYLFIIPGLICYALAKSGKVPELTAHDRPGRQVHPGDVQRGLPHDGAIPAAARACAALWWPDCFPP